MIDPALILIQTLSGLSTGSVLFLSAVGLSIIFGVLNVVNFAHGSLFMAGAYFTFFSIEKLFDGSTIGIFVSFFIIAPVGGILLGTLIERSLTRLRGRREEMLYSILLTYGISLTFAELVKLSVGSTIYSIPKPSFLSGTLIVFDNYFPIYNLFLILIGIAVFITVWGFLNKTEFGTTVRAVILDREMANALGINVKQIFFIAFAMGAALTGFAGGLSGALSTVNPTMWSEILVLSFLVVAIGGIGSIKGALIGSLLVGLSKSFGILFIAPGLSLAIPFVVLVVVLNMRPQGLFKA